MNRKRRRRRRFALLVLLAMILAAALGIQFRIRPMLRTIAEIQVVNAASSALAGAVNRQMSEGTADYGGLISFEKDTSIITQGDKGFKRVQRPLGSKGRGRRRVLCKRVV